MSANLRKRLEDYTPLLQYGADILSTSSPGRFFAANQLKLTLAHIALYYEIEPIAARPVNKWFVGSMSPPLGDTLRVRRRKV